MAVEILSGFGFFMPIFSFLLVFIIVYALLAKTQILGESIFIHLLVSFLLAAFFIVNISLVEFIKFSSAWIVVFIVCIFLILLIVGFVQGKLDIVQNAKWISWVVIILLVIFFIISSSVTFKWAITLEQVKEWASQEWVGFVLLLIVAGVASWIISKSK